MNLRITFAATVLASLVSTAALAQTSPPNSPPPVPAPDSGKVVSVTISPLHLLSPIIELTGEFAPLRKVGVAGILGAGSIVVEDAFGQESSFTVLELGAQGNYYVVGDFDHGMQLGAEALLVHVSGEDPGNVNVTGTGQGFAIGPYLGYKVAAGFGLTFFGQLGAQYNFATAEATDGTTTETGSASGVNVLLNLNLGWSF